MRCFLTRGFILAFSMDDLQNVIKHFTTGSKRTGGRCFIDCQWRVKSWGMLQKSITKKYRFTGAPTRTFSCRIGLRSFGEKTFSEMVEGNIKSFFGLFNAKELIVTLSNLISSRSCHRTTKDVRDFTSWWKEQINHVGLHYHRLFTNTKGNPKGRFCLFWEHAYGIENCCCIFSGEQKNVILEIKLGSNNL